MVPFKIPHEISTIKSYYPEAKLLMDAARHGGEQSRAAIARLWLSEGIPFAFKEKPALYDSIRSWLSNRLSVDAKDIHLTGSARLGQSLAPKKLGQAFGQHSDLDLFVVSSTLFEKIKAEFNLWSYRFESGIEAAKNDTELKFWRENLYLGPKNLGRGFLDSKIIPNRDQYPNTQNISQSMWLLKGKLDITTDAPTVKEASVRCYSDWRSFVRQSSLSFLSDK